jgi:hypothetical protein
MKRNSAQDTDRAPMRSTPVDAFLWDPLSAAPSKSTSPRAFVKQEELLGEVIDITPVAQNEHLVPAGMFNQWPLEVLFHITKPFTGLVVLIDIVTTRRKPSHDESLLQSITGCVAGLLGENDFGCRTTEDEFVMVCPGQQGAEAQRRLNQISEQLWEFQQRLHGSCSLLFSWGGIGAAEKPLADAVAAAVQRMTQINRIRKGGSMESVKHRRKVV